MAASWLAQSAALPGCLALTAYALASAQDPCLPSAAAWATANACPTSLITHTGGRL